MDSRRIAAVVLPQLACEIVRQRVSVEGPLAVIVDRPGDEPSNVLHVVDDEARRYGVRPGQESAESAVLVSRLAVHRVTTVEIASALGRVAEIALGFGPTAAIALSDDEDDAPFDTVWLDVSGSAHLVGGEEALLDLLAERVTSLGHRVRAAVADGARLAQALARFGTSASAASMVVPNGQGKDAMASLPVRALPISAMAASFLVRVGIMTIGDLARLPRDSAHARLGAPFQTAGDRDRATLALDLAVGRDPTPLVPYAPPRVLSEEVAFEEAVVSAEALLFVARGMTARLAVRLAARGEACSRLDVVVDYDRSIARLREADPANRGGDHEPGNDSLHLAVDLPVPLAEANDLFRALKAKLDGAPLFAPAIKFTLAAPTITRARRVQLDLSRDARASPDALPTLLAELSAEIGPDRVGVLAVLDAHRPEARSRLLPARSFLDRKALDSLRSEQPIERCMPTRLLSAPVPLGPIAIGTVVGIDKQLYAIDTLQFVMRLDGVEWWQGSVSRDYLRARVTSGGMSGDAFVYVERSSREGYLQGWYE